MTVEGGGATPRLYHEFQCDCGLWVRSEEWVQIEKIANGHARKCKQPSVQRTQPSPFTVAIPEGEE